TTPSNSADNSAECHTARTSRAAPARSLANKATHGRCVAPFLPQPCFCASAQERQAGPIGASLDKAIVIIEAGGIVGITQQCPFDELLGRRIVNGGRKSRCITKLVLLHQLEGLLQSEKRGR